jgi:hypothetical protein
MRRTVLATLVLGLSAISALAQFPGPGSSWYQGTVPEYVNFTTVQTNIDLGDLGGPLFTGVYTSPSTIVEVDANVYLQANVLNGANASENAGGRSLPTVFVTQVKGEGNINGTEFSSPGAYAGGLVTNPGEAWFVMFKPGTGNGVTTAVNITRNGLNDYAGSYGTSTAIGWVKW